MVPRIAKAGRSFKGAALYYLHDKGASTSERVAFVETANLATNDPDIAVAHMVDTATHAAALKKAAGIKGGRPLQTPVYTFSLAWHPSETPTKAEQLEAAQEALNRLGLADRQAVFIGHNDTDHPHVHVMVNRVCQDTGRAANLGNDRLVLSDWALAYRKERGQDHYCPNRAENHAKRQQSYVKDDSMSRQQWVAWKKGETAKLWDEFRTDRAKASPVRKSQFDALWEQRQTRTAQRRDEIKKLFKPEWRDTFKRQKQELKEFDESWIARVNFVLAQPRHKVMGLFMAIADKGALRRELELGHEAERKKLGFHQRARTNDALREVTKAWKYDRDQLRDMHRKQDDAAHQQTKAKVDEVWQDKSLNRSGEDFEAAKDRRKPDSKAKRNSFEAFFGEDEEAIKKAREQQEKRRQTNRKRKRQRGRNRDDGGRDFEP